MRHQTLPFTHGMDRGRLANAKPSRGPGHEARRPAILGAPVRPKLGSEPLMNIDLALSASHRERSRRRSL